MSGSVLFNSSFAACSSHPSVIVVNHHWLCVEHPIRAPFLKQRRLQRRYPMSSIPLSPILAPEPTQLEISELPSLPVSRPPTPSSEEDIVEQVIDVSPNPVQRDDTYYFETICFRVRLLTKTFSQKDTHQLRTVLG